MTHGTWYPTGGDWTYIDFINKLYEKNNHTIIPFSMLHEKNDPNVDQRFFVSNIDYSQISKKKGLSKYFNVASRAIYSAEAVNKLNLLLEKSSIDIAQLNSIHNIQTLSILPVLKEHSIPIVWRVLDYKILCPNRTFLSNSSLCTKCLKGSYYWSSLKSCNKNNFMASTLASFESYFIKFKNYYDLVDIFMLQNEFTKKLFISAGFDERKLRVINNPYSLDSTRDNQNFSTNDMRINSMLKKKYILYFGRLSKEKGVHTLIKAMKKINNVDLVIIGDGPEYNNLLEFSKKFGENRVHFLGPLWGNDLNTVISNSLLTVCPSEWYEVSPYVVMQSLSLGKPVVAADIGGIPEIIKSDFNGQLFESGNSLSLACAVNKQISSNDSSKTSDNCYSTVLNNHSPDGYYSATMDIFKDLKCE